MMKKIMYVCLLFLTVLSVTSCKKVKFDESKKTLVVGLECDYAPFNWLETTKSETNYPVENVSGGYAEGYDVQIAKAICKELGYTLVIKKISFDGLISALDSGAIDAIIAGMSPTDERKLSIQFSDAYYHTKHVLLCLKDSPYVTAKTFQQLSGAKVIGQLSTTYDTLAKQISQKNSNCTYLQGLETIPLIVNAIKSNVADITVLEEPVGKGLVSRDDNLTYFALDEAFDLNEADTIVSVGLRKIDTALCEKINQALANITQEMRDTYMETAVNAGEN